MMLSALSSQKFSSNLIFCLIACFLTALISVDFRDKILFWFDSEDKYLSKEERLVNHILYETASAISKKNEISVIGTTISMPGGHIKKLGLDFNSYQNLSKTQMRKLLIEFGQMLLQNTVSNDEVQPFLAKKPFTIKEVEIVIYNHDRQRYHTNDPEIGIGDLYNGVITYRTHDPDKKFGYKNKFEETYDEALKLLQAQKD